ncbi:Imm10 family immunity protein [Pseudoduganella sp. R-31]|uniref:Imm10 family immunity protein n=1 Tax=Pseudoduganella sp. R-31 TaxID=3404060 RepID=UPI003CF809FB
MSKKLEFDATVVSVDEQDEAYIVGFADDAMEPSQYIILQRSTEEDEQDDELGLNTYFLEIGNPSVSGYGGISSAKLKHSQMELNLRQPSDYANEVEQIIVRFHASQEEREQLARHLELIFRDSDCALNIG